VSYSYLIVALLIVFGAIGFWRGWLREAGTLAGLLVAWMVLIAAGEAFVSIANRIYLMAAFILQDGFDARQPATLIQSLRRNPLVDPRHPDLFLGIIFVVLGVVAFVAANRYIAPATGWPAQVLGCLVGLANGYLVTYLGFHYFAPTARVRLPVWLGAGDAADALGRYLPTLLVAGVLLAIGVALLSSRRFGGKGSPRVAPGRTKG
jgi:hypothetical protein